MRGWTPLTASDRQSGDVARPLEAGFVPQASTTGLDGPGADCPLWGKKPEKADTSCRAPKAGHEGRFGSNLSVSRQGRIGSLQGRIGMELACCRSRAVWRRCGDDPARPVCLRDGPALGPSRRIVTHQAPVGSYRERFPSLDGARRATGRHHAP